MPPAHANARGLTALLLCLLIALLPLRALAHVAMAYGAGPAGVGASHVSVAERDAPGGQTVAAPHAPAHTATAAPAAVQRPACHGAALSATPAADAVPPHALSHGVAHGAGADPADAATSTACSLCALCHAMLALPPMPTAIGALPAPGSLRPLAGTPLWPAGPASGIYRPPRAA